MSQNARDRTARPQKRTILMEEYVPPRPELRFVKELIRTEKCGLYKDFYCLKTDLLVGCELRGVWRVGGGPREVPRPRASENPTEGVEQRSKSNL